MKLYKPPKPKKKVTERIVDWVKSIPQAGKAIIRHEIDLYTLKIVPSETEGKVATILYYIIFGIVIVLSFTIVYSTGLTPEYIGTLQNLRIKELCTFLAQEDVRLNVAHMWAVFSALLLVVAVHCPRE